MFRAVGINRNLRRAIAPEHMKMRRVMIGEEHRDLSARKAHQAGHLAEVYVQWLHKSSPIARARRWSHRHCVRGGVGLTTPMRQFLTALALLASAPAQAQTPPACPPAGYDRARLEALRAADFEIADGRERQRFARALAPCVASPDPFLRDAIGFEALSHMLRANRLNVATQTVLINDLLPRLESADAQGFERPFAALVLSELVRAERLNPYFSDARRAEVLDRSLAYFVNVRDYRGFDEREGWRHGVAHGADLLLQLAAAPTTQRADLIRIRDAIATQIAPVGHFYIYGEFERLARPILVMAERGVFSADEWSAWLAQVSAPAPLASWREAFSSQAGLARKHNVAAFAYVIWANASLSQDQNIRALSPGAEAALRALP